MADDLPQPFFKRGDGLPVEQGLILADKLRPARRGNQPILYVEWQQDHWEPLKLN